MRLKTVKDIRKASLPLSPPEYPEEPRCPECGEDLVQDPEDMWGETLCCPDCGYSEVLPEDPRVSDAEFDRCCGGGY